MTAGGTSGTCSGVLTLDRKDFLSTHPGALGNPRSIEQVFQAQAWYRDPAASQSSSSSDAIEFTLGP